MAWRNSFLAFGLASALLPASAALAADHLDGAAVTSDKSTDINDVYSFMSADGTKVELIMTVFPLADKTSSKFSNAAHYVFHTASRPNFANATGVVPLDIICDFDAAQTISCWVGDNTHFLSGNANNPAGLTSADSRIKVFAGVRKDHFFFNLNGFNQARAAVMGAAPANCAAINAGTAAFVVNKLTHDDNNVAGSLAPTDFFKDLNTLAIVMEIDKTLLNTGGKFFSVWGATHKKQ